MATTRAWAIYASLEDAVAYILDLKHAERKTRQGRLVYCSHASSGSVYTAASVWAWQQGSRSSPTGQHPRIQGWHFQQSFAPGTVLDLQVLEIAREWMDAVTEKKYPYVLAVHTDTAHLHAHIIVHPYDEKHRAWKIYWKKDRARFAALSDAICLRHGLAVLPACTGHLPMESAVKLSAGKARELILSVVCRLALLVPAVRKLCTLLERLGFQVLDLDAPRQIMKEKPDVYAFTVHEKMLSRKKEDWITVRLPVSKSRVRMKADWVKQMADTKVYCITLPRTQTLQLEENREKRLPASEVYAAFAQKKKKEAQTLWIRAPFASSFVRADPFLKVQGPVDDQSAQLVQEAMAAKTYAQILAVRRKIFGPHQAGAARYVSSWKSMPADPWFAAVFKDIQKISSRLLLAQMDAAGGKEASQLKARASALSGCLEQMQSQLQERNQLEEELMLRLQSASGALEEQDVQAFETRVVQPVRQEAVRLEQALHTCRQQLEALEKEGAAAGKKGREIRPAKRDMER